MLPSTCRQSKQLIFFFFWKTKQMEISVVYRKQQKDTADRFWERNTWKGLNEAKG